MRARWDRRLTREGRGTEGGRLITISRAACLAVGLAGGFVLVGCSANGLQPSLAQAGAPHANHRQSWIARDAKTTDLLYVSDEGTNDVDIYSYPKGTLVGMLTGFSFPEGECTDKNGDVFVANDDEQNVPEYARGGTTPIAILNDAGYYPVGCSVDKKTGNLAVTNTFNTSFTNGAVAIYKHAQGDPTYYTNSVLVYPHLCGYDAKGNLDVDGFNTSFAFQFGVLPRASATFTDVTLNQSIGFPGGVQWDGNYVAVGDGDTNTIYQFIIAGSGGTVTGSTPLTGARDVAQFWKQGSTVIGPDTLNADVGFWSYPGGGYATQVITGLSQPFGATISRKK
jgi:hypothetical protein